MAPEQCAARLTRAIVMRASPGSPEMTDWGKGTVDHGKAGLCEVRAQAPGLPMRQRDAGREEARTWHRHELLLSKSSVKAKTAWKAYWKVAHRAARVRQGHVWYSAAGGEGG